jgi:hypothetical protein
MRIYCEVYQNCCCCTKWISKTGLIIARPGQAPDRITLAPRTCWCWITPHIQRELLASAITRVSIDLSGGIGTSCDVPSRILIVEDEPAIRKMLAEFFPKGGTRC